MQIKRIYLPVEEHDGHRVLVDRLWPRGVKKSDAQLDHWLKELGPSTQLRKWFDHQEDRWSEFQVRYKIELSLDASSRMVNELRELSRIQTVTLVYAARDELRNNAVVVRDFIGRDLAS